jgi:protease PrsW
VSGADGPPEPEPTVPPPGRRTPPPPPPAPAPITPPPTDADRPVWEQARRRDADERPAGDPTLPPPPPPASSPAARTGRSLPPSGWYPDPLHPQGAWRWWDGHHWTGYVDQGRRSPRLPAWLSVPVLVSGILVLPGVAYTAVVAPASVLLPLPSFLVLIAVFVWFDRLEPEPWQERVHGVLWGGTVAVLVASIANVATYVAAGEVAMLVVSAPIVEEVMKGLGILYAARRRTVDSVTDGIVYAGWIAAGFALVENVEYFQLAAEQGELLLTVVVRGVLTPFAHPLFTIWIGIGIGRAVVRGTNPGVGALPGLALAIALHAAWNGANVLAFDGGVAAAVLLGVGFVVLFVATAVVLTVGRVRARDRTASTVPAIAARYGLTEQEVAAFSDWRRTLAVRRALPRSERAAFDARHAAVARLAALHHRAGPPDAAVEAELVDRLWRARTTGR